MYSNRDSNINKQKGNIEIHSPTNQESQLPNAGGLLYTGIVFSVPLHKTENDQVLADLIDNCRFLLLVGDFSNLPGT
jgi:hypothetical protein